MDINATLTELRALTSDNADREFISDHDAARMVELAQALDEWLTNGGFLPTDWARNR